MLYKAYVFTAYLLGAVTSQSILELAKATPALSTLVAVLEDSNFAPVATALSGTGPFTVFAPTNDAFAAANIDLAFAQANVAAVTSILQYHVVGSKVLSTDLAAGSNNVDSLEGTYLRVGLYNDEVKVNDKATVTTANVEASNGVVHIVDAVIMPIPQSIVANAAATADLSKLVEVVSLPAYQGILTALSGAGTFTVFAPTNAAFDAAGIDTSDVATVTKVLQYHVLTSIVFSADLAASQMPATLEGSTVTVTKDANGVMINGDAKVVTADVQSSNGVVHVIDKVLMPSDGTASPTMPEPAPTPLDGAASTVGMATSAIFAVAITVGLVF